MTYNVCRPFVLYNDFLPPDTEPHREWQYLVFGYFDGIMVGGNIFDEGICSLERLWDYDMEQIKALEGRYSFQIIYGFRSDDETHYDEVFWKEALTEETEYPFIFITLFQGNISKYMYIREKCNFEKQLTDVGKRKVITYLTLDNSSMVMVLLCCEYRDGAAVIDDFHRGEGKILLEKMGIKLSYSFTLAAIQKMYLNSPAIDSMQGSDSLIENVYIYAIEKYPGSIEEIRGRIEKQLGKQVKKESILGCNDEVIVVDNISWFEFLKWFQSSTGILNHSSWEYEQYLLGVTTIIARSQMSVKSSEKDGDEDARRFYRDFSEVLRTRIREILYLCPLLRYCRWKKRLKKIKNACFLNISMNL